MMNPFISIEYIAVALLKAKYEFYGEDFISMSELNQFRNAVQLELNQRESGFVIVSQGFSRDDFKRMSSVLMATDDCYFDIYQLPSIVFDLLTNKNFILNFLIGLEQKKLQKLESIQMEVSKSYQKEKV